MSLQSLTRILTDNIHTRTALFSYLYGAAASSGFPSNTGFKFLAYRNAVYGGLNPSRGSFKQNARRARKAMK